MTSVPRPRMHAGQGGVLKDADAVIVPLLHLHQRALVLNGRIDVRTLHVITIPYCIACYITV